ncbi:hypothetical protein [Asticcacaulis endophyticus]|uniref:Rod shape-determining protein MreD n=1 Tax=Asticcacaulis endophyticus TaxID=1395890 RepID=A0A918Q1F3_9CAUL|nr:hypothetical protein [Asticcacaulis endophyticus]GGZ30241.1 hypothetical protein GCM10011273_15600 [Asticcacaulis endophyticus]
MKTPFIKTPLKVTLDRGVRKGMAQRMIGPLDWIGWPALGVLAATIVLATPMKVFGLYLPEPVLPLALAFAWPLIRPSYVAPLVLALMGAFLDYFWGAPLGFWTLSLMIVYGVIFLLRGYMVGQDMMVIAGLYGVAVIGFFILTTLMATIDSGMVPRLISVFEQALATFASVFLVLWLLESYVHADVRFQ